VSRRANQVVPLEMNWAVNKSSPSFWVKTGLGLGSAGRIAWPLDDELEGLEIVAMYRLVFWLVTEHVVSIVDVPCAAKQM
jgi:hypothetical protein